MEIPAHRPTIGSVQDAVTAYYKLPPVAMQSAVRRRSWCRPRQIAMFLSVRMTGKSLPKIGKMFQRDHTTVMHGERMIEMLIEKDARLAYDVREIERQLMGPQ